MSPDSSSVTENAVECKRAGNECFAQRKLEEAERCYREALRWSPLYAEALNNLGCVLKEQGKLVDAELVLRQALLADPALPQAYKNLGDLLRAKRRLDEAEEACRRCIALLPAYADAYNSLGVILNQRGKLQAAADAYRQALEIKPDYSFAMDNLCSLLTECDRDAEAETIYRRFLDNFPDDADARFLFSLFLLKIGKFDEGWHLHETRYDPCVHEPVAPLPTVAYPQWRGEPLAGKSLLIWYEQGFGDEIQLCRYASLLKRMGVARITLVCKPQLRVLLESLADADAIVATEEVPKLSVHDFWTLPLSIPLHLKTTLCTIPASLPYLSAAPERLELWRHRLPPNGLRVGLIWKGSSRHHNDVNRSMPDLATLVPLWGVPGVSFVSLQKGAGEDEARQPSPGQPLVHLGSDIQDFADCAAIISQLDLVICVDTAAAHLAGALGKPCWVMLPRVGADWRWLQTRSDSPWYPGVMRLFRQPAAGDWKTALDETAQALREFASGTN